MLHTPACDILRIRHPVCQAGMAGYTSPELVAAVSRAGGLGVHGSLGRSPDDLRRLFRATHAILRGEPFGVNLVIRRTDDAILDLCLEERVPVIALSWGDPRPWAARAHAAGAIILYQVTTMDEVPTALVAGVDLLIAQGTEGGGHSGFVPLITLLPAVVAAAGTTPVLAAGGIADGRGLAAALVLGAAGAYVGTRFLATPEAPVSAAWKASIVAAGVGDTIHTLAFDTLWGRPWPGGRVRAVANRFTADWDGREELLLTHHAAMQQAVWQAERDDDPGLISLMAGTGVAAIREIIPAATVVESMVADATAIISGLGTLLRMD
jgi:NAD(P)H-dependent flavin oxidoreductase YrpB (nitropropane dioxygenase family)